MSLSMSKAEREAFLADVHVAVLSVARPDRPPLTVPVWYAYEPGGDICIATGAQAKKTGCIRAAAQASLCVQTETPPYKYVTVEGPTTIVPLDDDAFVRRVAHRYLGEQVGDYYVQSTAAERARSGEVLIRLTPQRWLTVDYAKMGG